MRTASRLICRRKEKEEKRKRRKKKKKRKRSKRRGTDGRRIKVSVEWWMGLCLMDSCLMAFSIYDAFR